MPAWPFVQQVELSTQVVPHLCVPGAQPGGAGSGGRESGTSAAASLAGTSGPLPVAPPAPLPAPPPAVAPPAASPPSVVVPLPVLPPPLGAPPVVSAPPPFVAPVPPVPRTTDGRDESTGIPPVPPTAPPLPESASGSVLRRFVQETRTRRDRAWQNIFMRRDVGYRISGLGARRSCALEGARSCRLCATRLPLKYRGIGRARRRSQARAALHFVRLSARAPNTCRQSFRRREASLTWLAELAST